MDESGNSGSVLSDPAQTHHYVGALLVPETSWHGVKRDMEEIAAEAGSQCLRDRRFEFHGNELFQGTGCWKATDFGWRLTIYERCIDLLAKHDLHVVIGCCDKSRFGEFGMTHDPPALAFMLCMERIAKVAQDRGANVILIADDSSDSVRKATREVIDSYRRTGPPFGTSVDLSCVIDTVHFLASESSLHLQLCDLALYALQRHERRPKRVLGSNGTENRYKDQSAFWSR